MKVYFRLWHPDSLEERISRGYSITELIETSYEEITDENLKCSCEPEGETNVVECKCDEYFDGFEIKNYFIESN